MTNNSGLNILINTGHPAQIHNFKEFKKVLESRGHNVYWSATDKDISKTLLKSYEIEYTLLKQTGKSLSSKYISLIRNTITTIRIIKDKRIDIAISRVSPFVTLACIIKRVAHLALTDTETAGMYDKLFGTFVSVLFTSTSFKRSLRSDQIRFNANIELFYLHPKRFTTSDDILKLLQVERDEPYVVMRFVSWDAYHDKGLSGFTDENKKKAVDAFSKYARVFISSEKELPEELEPYRIKIPPERMHDVLAHAKLFFGESATMASESAVLGTPAIYLNEHWLGYTNEEQEYGLLFSYKVSPEDQIAAIEKGFSLLQQPGLEEDMRQNRSRFLSEKIDPTAFMVWFIENYPESFNVMKENPDYQYNFK